MSTLANVIRYDIGELSAVERTDQGFLRAPAKITRTGVFNYRKADGSIRRELRTPAEVFTSGSLKSRFMASIKIQARRYDMPMVRAAAEIEPSRFTASSKSALPGPSATAAPIRTRSRGVESRSFSITRSNRPNHAPVKGIPWY